MRWFTILALALAIGLAGALSPFASASPDGLERVARDHGFAAAARTHRAPVAGYAVGGVHDARLATGLAGFLGTLVVFGAAVAVVRR
jgi:hypothetical protein